jgi:hypothetical protein
MSCALSTLGFEVSFTGATSLNHQTHMSIHQDFGLNACVYFSWTSYDADRSILTIIILFASCGRTVPFHPTGAHGFRRPNTARSTRIGAASVRIFFDTMAALVDRGGNGYCAHTRDSSYQRLIVRSK